MTKSKKSTARDNGSLGNILCISEALLNLTEQYINKEIDSLKYTHGFYKSYSELVTPMVKHEILKESVSDLGRLAEEFHGRFSGDVHESEVLALAVKKYPTLKALVESPCYRMGCQTESSIFPMYYAKYGGRVFSASKNLTRAGLLIWTEDKSISSKFGFSQPVPDLSIFMRSIPIDEIELWWERQLCITFERQEQCVYAEDEVCYYFKQDSAPEIRCIFKDSVSEPRIVDRALS